MTTRFLQIDKGRCAGDRKIFDEIKDIIIDSGKFAVSDDGVVFLIMEKEEEKPQIIEESKKKKKKMEVIA